MNRPPGILNEATADLAWLRWNGFPGTFGLGPSRREGPA
jgi:hypothetical protein